MSRERDLFYCRILSVLFFLTIFSISLVAPEIPLSFRLQSSFPLAALLRNRNAAYVKTCQQFKTTKCITQAVVPSPLDSWWYIDPFTCLWDRAELYNKTIIVSLTYSRAPLPWIHVSAGPWGCQFECKIRTNFGQDTDSALPVTRREMGWRLTNVHCTLCARVPP